MMLKNLVKMLTLIVGLAWAFVVSAAAAKPLLPEARYIAYNVWQGMYQEIYLLDVDRGLAQSLTRSRVDAGRPMWSPDGSQIAFEGAYEGGSSIYLMDTFGGNLHLLAMSEAGNQYTPVWFKDGTGLFFRNVPSEGALAFRINLDGTGLERIEVINYEYLIPRRYDPTRTIIAGQHNGQTGIFIARDRERGLERLVETDVAFRDYPQWSPDEHQIAFVSWSDNRTEIYLMNSDGSDFRQITDDGLLKGNLAWRP